jgi:hypothetical protein
MGISRGRLMLAVATTVATIATLGAAPSTAAAVTEYRDTTMVGGQPNPLKLHLLMQPRAKLTDSLTGAPVVGQRVDFWLNLGPLPAAGPICVSQTDANGVAKCPFIGYPDSLYLVMYGYEARFSGATVGDVRHNQSRDYVKFLGVQ